MNIQGLESFLTVAECGSFSLAAQKLYVTQPAISHQIAQLEKELDVKLFERGGGAVTLTAAGRECLSIARSIVGECGRLKMTAARFCGKIAGRFSVGFVNNRTNEICAPVFREMALRHPDLKLDLHYIRMVPMLPALKERKLDMLFVSEPAVKNRSWIDYRPLNRCGLVAVAAPSHPLAARRSIRYCDLAGEQLFLNERENYPEEYDLIVSELQAHGVGSASLSPKATTEEILALVSLGQGIGLLGGGLLRSYLGKLRALPIEDSSPSHSTVAAWRKGESSPVIPEFFRLFEALPSLEPDNAASAEKPSCD